MNAKICKCCRCRNIHSFEQRIDIKDKKDKCISKSTCPKCCAESYYVMPEKFKPFSNCTEFITWQSKNCDRCSKYEHESTMEENAKCKLAFNIDLASVSSGEIPFLIANQIGISKKKLVSKCREFDKA